MSVDSNSGMGNVLDMSDDGILHGVVARLWEMLSICFCFIGKCEGTE